MLGEAFPPTPGRKQSPSHEAGGSPEASEKIRMLPEKGREIPFAVDESGKTQIHPNTGAAETVPRHVEIPNRLARKICSNLSVPQIGA